MTVKKKQAVETVKPPKLERTPKNAKPPKGWFYVRVDGTDRLYNPNQITWILPTHMCADGRFMPITADEYNGFLDAII